MRTILLALGLLACLSVLAQAGQEVMVRQSWARVYSEPRTHSRTLATVYGNDRLAALERRDGWVRVRLHNGRTGWLAAGMVRWLAGGEARRRKAQPEVTGNPSGPVLRVLNPRERQKTRAMLKEAARLKAIGYSVEAADLWIDLILHYPATEPYFDAIEALANHLGRFNLVEKRGRAITRFDLVQAGYLAEELLVAQGNTLLARGRHVQAARVFTAVLYDKSRVRREAEAGLQSTLTSYLGKKTAGAGAGDDAMLKALARWYFPG